MSKRLAREIRILLESLPSITRGQASLLDTETDEYTTVLLRLTPSSGYYNGDTIDFKLNFEETYPIDPPQIICQSDIYHPNIDTSTYEDTNVCLNLFDSEFWCEGFGIQGCVFGLLFLLENPNFDDPISPYFQPRDTLQEYIDDIGKHRKGNRVGFMQNLLDEAITYSLHKSCDATSSVSDEVISRCDNKDEIETTGVINNGITIDKINDKTYESSDLGEAIDVKSQTISCGLVSQSNKLISKPDLFEKETSFEDYCGENTPKRQISEDNIVEASSKIFRKLSGEYCEEKMERRLSLIENPDYEELMSKVLQNAPRQISEDNIVEASSKISRKLSGEYCEEKTERRLSLIENPDYEELMYVHFMNNDITPV